MSASLVVASVLATAPCLGATRPPAPAGAWVKAQAQAGGGVQAPRPLPDLRIVELKAIPAPVPDGGPVTLALMLHNASTSVAAGNIAIEAIHDRSLPQPLPIHRRVIYMGPDALVEVSFEVPRVSMTSSPYTFFVMIDVFDEIEEADESNNTAWRRIAVCGDPEGEEVADGFDNDCDGLTDEGLGLPADTGDALEMLRAAQRRAALDAAPLVYATPRYPEGFARRRTARLASEEGQFIVSPAAATASPRGGGRRGNQRGNRRGGRRGQSAEPAVGDLSATASREDPAAELRLTDWNGGDLVSGDPISLQDRNGAYIVADIVRNGRLVTRAESRQREHFFTVIKVSDDTRADDPMIRSGDRVALAASNGRFLHAEGGGGGPLRANREAISGWETFTLTLDDDGGSR